MFFVSTVLKTDKSNNDILKCSSSTIHTKWKQYNCEPIRLSHNCLVLLPIFYYKNIVFMD